MQFFFLLDKPELCYVQNSVFPVRLCGCQTIYLDFLSNNWHAFIAFFNRLIAGIWYSIWRCKHKVRRRESQKLMEFLLYRETRSISRGFKGHLARGRCWLPHVHKSCEIYKQLSPMTWKIKSYWECANNSLLPICQYSSHL